jgi:hypothetical protein
MTEAEVKVSMPQKKKEMAKAIAYAAEYHAETERCRRKS